MTDLIKREDAIKYCKSKADHYRKRLARIEAQGDAIGYDPTEQIKGFKDEIAIYESFVKELEEIPSAEPTISKMEQVDKDTNVRSKAVYDKWGNVFDARADIEDEPQTDIEIARAIVHKAIDDAVIAEDAYPDLRQKMHDAVDNYDPQTERSE